jgi:hypothetical protein
MKPSSFRHSSIRILENIKIEKYFKKLMSELNINSDLILPINRIAVKMKNTE